ncbi:response regulator [Hyalangium gracile]|uniref:response regulator n=1 Tax=Hyalangium gracile TaxID=394092 RepID=UPI001CCA3CA8|nr:response regulator [Hyalangium gracile]
MEKPRIIIVDDDRDTRELLAMALETEGFEVSSAANGLRLISSLQLRRPHLILLDVNMSWIDGFELCKAVKKNENFRDIPVIFVSGRGEPEDRRKGMEAGAADYFVKPLDLNRLIARIRELIPAPAPEEH